MALVRQAEFDIMYDSGICKTGGILDLAVKHDIVKKSGTWYSYGDDRIGQGRDNAKQFLADNPGIASDIERRILIEYGLIVEEKAEKPEAVAVGEK